MENRSFDGKLYNEDIYNADQTNGRHFQVILMYVWHSVDIIQELVDLYLSRILQNYLIFQHHPIPVYNWLAKEVRKVMNICHKYNQIVES